MLCQFRNTCDKVIKMKIGETSQFDFTTTGGPPINLDPEACDGTCPPDPVPAPDCVTAGPTRGGKCQIDNKCDEAHELIFPMDSQARATTTVAVGAGFKGTSNFNCRFAPLVKPGVNRRTGFSMSATVEKPLKTVREMLTSATEEEGEGQGEGQGGDEGAAAGGDSSGACSGVQVSGIKLAKVAKEDGMWFWKSKADPYVILTLNGEEKKTKVHKDAKTAEFKGTFCFPGKASVDALKASGLKVSVVDADKGDFMAGKDDPLGSFTTKASVQAPGKKLAKCEVSLAITVKGKAV